MKKAFVILSLLILVNILGAQAPRSTYTPSINEFVKVDREPIPINASLIKDKIGYPVEAAKNKIEGKVFVRVLIGTDGFIKNYKITRSDHACLSDAVTEEIDLFKYLPALKGDSLVSQWTNISFKFYPSMGQHVKAQKHSYKTLVQKIFKSSNKNSQASLDEGFVQFEKRAYKLAGRSFKNCIMQTPKSKSQKAQIRLFQAYYHLGHVYTQLRSWELARKYYTEAIGMSRSLEKSVTMVDDLLPTLYLGRGYALLHMENPSRALADYNWVTHNFPDLFLKQERTSPLPPLPWRTDGDWVNYQKGLVYLQLDKHAEAVVHFDKAEQYEPAPHLRLAILSHKGLAKSKLGEFEGAFNDIQAAIELNEDDPQPYFLKAMILMELESQEMASEVLAQAQELFEKVEISAAIPAMYPSNDD